MRMVLHTVCVLVWLDTVWELVQLTRAARVVPLLRSHFRCDYLQAFVVSVDYRDDDEGVYWDGDYCILKLVDNNKALFFSCYQID